MKRKNRPNACSMYATCNLCFLVPWHIFLSFWECAKFLSNQKWTIHTKYTSNKHLWKLQLYNMCPPLHLQTPWLLLFWSLILRSVLCRLIFKYRFITCFIPLHFLTHNSILHLYWVLGAYANKFEAYIG